MQSTRMQADSSSGPYKMQNYGGLYETVGDEEDLPSCAFAGRSSMQHYLSMAGELNFILKSYLLAHFLT